MFEISIFRFCPTHGDQVDIDIDNYQRFILVEGICFDGIILLQYCFSQGIMQWNNANTQENITTKFIIPY